MPEALEVQHLTRGVNEILILAALQSQPKHGYQIALEIEERSGGYFSFNHGTLYPILHHLENQGLIDGTWDEGRGSRRKKEYVLTLLGRTYLRDRFGEWNSFHEHLSAFVVASSEVPSRAASNQR